MNVNKIASKGLENLSKEEYDFLANNEPSTLADLIWDYRKTHGKPLTLKQSLVHIEQDHRLC